jgi:hypothetical protein
MATITLDAHQTGSLVRATDGSLDNETSALRNLDGLGGDLFSKLTGGRNDQSPNVRRASASGAVAALRLGSLESRVAKDVLHGRDEEGEGFACSGLSLGKAEGKEGISE